MSPIPKPAAEKLCRPVELWPEADQLGWQLALAPRPIFEEEGGELADRSPVSVNKYAKGWGRWLSFLAAYDPTALELPAGGRCSKERVQDYVEHLRESGNSDRTVINRLQELVVVAAILDPGFDLAMINRFIGTLRSDVVPVRSKAHVRPSNELVDLGFRLMGEATDASSVEDAITYRDGLVIAFLAFHPIRRKNLARLEIGKNLIRHSDGWWLVLRHNETKTHEYYEAPVAEVLVEAFDTYLRIWRPILAAQTGRWTAEVGNAVWVSADGSPMTAEGLSNRIELHTEAAFGKAISPHRFRDAAATTLAVEDPAHVRAAAPLLGHRSLATTEKHYIQAKGLEAQRSFLDVIQEARNAKR